MALLVAILVAVSEGVLYLIWDARRTEPKSSRIHKFSARRVGTPVKADVVQSNPPSTDGADPAAGSSERGYDRTSSARDSLSDSTTTLPLAQANVQVYVTTDGLRERGYRQR